MPNKIIARHLDSTSTNNLTRPLTQCASVLHHKAHIRDLNKGASASSFIADKMHSLHNKLRRYDVNVVGKHKQACVLTAGLVSIRHDTWITHEY